MLKLIQAAAVAVFAAIAATTPAKAQMYAKPSFQLGQTRFDELSVKCPAEIQRLGQPASARVYLAMMSRAQYLDLCARCSQARRGFGLSVRTPAMHAGVGIGIGLGGNRLGGRAGQHTGQPVCPAGETFDATRRKCLGKMNDIELTEEQKATVDSCARLVTRKVERDDPEHGKILVTQQKCVEFR